MKKESYLIITAILLTFSILGIVVFYLFEEVRFSPDDYTSREVWLIPNTETPDYLEFFEDEEKWPIARKNIDVFGFYLNTFLNDCSFCGPANYSNLIAVDAFSKLTNWGIGITIEVPVVKVWANCEVNVPIIVSNQGIQLVENNGGEVTHLVMDEPFFYGQHMDGGETCGFTAEQSAIRTAEYINEIKALHPGIKIGDNEAFPIMNAQQHIEWLTALENQGIQLDFYQLDVNRHYPTTINKLDEMRQIKEFVESKGILYGVIYWGDPRPHTFSSQVYYDDVINWTRYIKENDLGGNRHTFQSWTRDPAGITSIPINLPENDSSVYSHTRIIRDGMAIILDEDAHLINHNLPDSINTSSSVTVSITLLNNGSEDWYGEGGYKLNLLNDNWGISEVPLGFDEVVVNGTEKIFTFSITAPNETGNYSFEAIMTHEGIEDIGSIIYENITVNLVPIVIPVQNPTSGTSSGSSGSSSGSSGGVIPPINNNPNQCNDDLDNDNDGLIDYPSDPGCSSINGNSELNNLPEQEVLITEEEPNIEETTGKKYQIKIVFWIITLILMVAIIFATIQIIRISRFNNRIREINYSNYQNN